MKQFHLVLALLAALVASPVLAQQEVKIGRWTVEKRPKDLHCNASWSYNDPDDENRRYAIVLSYSDKAIVVVIVYEGWEWDKIGEILKADIATDQGDLMAKAKWEVVEKTIVRGVFEYDQAFLGKISRAKRLILDFEGNTDDSIDVEIPLIDEVVVALKSCEDNRK